MAEIKTRPVTAEYVEGHERVFGVEVAEIKQPSRNRYFYRPGNPRANERGFVAEADLGAEHAEVLAKDAAIMAGRFYENVGAMTDGTPINSRQDLRNYHARTGSTHTGDYTETWKKAEKEREAIRLTGGTPQEHAARRDAIGRAIYELRKP